MNNKVNANPRLPVPSRPGPWGRLVDRSRVLEYVDVCLRGCGQVMFQNNPLSGLLFLLAIVWGAHVQSRPDIAVSAIVATAVGTGSAFLFDLDSDALHSGLYGYSSTLIGIALPTFLSPTVGMWACLVFGAAVSPIFTVTLAKVLKTWQVAALTAPFVFTTWFILLGADSFSVVHGSVLSAPMLPHQLIVSSLETPTASGILSAALYGIAQVFLLPSLISGALILVGLAISSGWALSFAVLGSILSLAAAKFLGADPSLLHGGMYGFCGVLTAVAIGHTFNRPSWRVLGYTVIAVLFTVIVQGALGALLSPFGLPVLTMPFVLASWLFLVPDHQLIPEHRP